MGHYVGAPKELYWSPKGALKDEFLDFMLLCFSSVLAPKSLQNGLQSGPGGAPGCPGGGPGGPGGGSDVQMSILEAPECRAGKQAPHTLGTRPDENSPQV